MIKRYRWLLVVVAIVLIARFVAYPALNRKVLRDQCAKDGGTLNAAGTSCSPR